MKPTQQEIIELAREHATRYTNRHYPDKPVFTFTQDALQKVIELALERFSAGGGEPVGEILNYVGDVDWISYVPLPKTKLYTHPSPTDLRAEYLRGLEDAARVCDERANAVFPNTKQGLGFSFSQQWDAGRESDKNCAYAIRALKGKQ